LANRTAVLICVMYFAQAYGFNFYVTWLPTYLKNVRGFTSVSLGLGVLASPLGGLTTDRLSRRFGLRIGRAAVGAGALLGAGACLMAGTSTASPYASALLIALGAAVANFMLPAAWGCCVDLGGPARRHSQRRDEHLRAGRRLPVPAHRGGVGTVVRVVERGRRTLSVVFSMP